MICYLLCFAIPFFYCTFSISRWILYFHSFWMCVCDFFCLNFVIDWKINDFICFRSQSVAINRILIYFFCWTMPMVASQMANARVIIFTIKPYAMTLINLHIGREVESICDFHARLDLTFIWYMHSHIALVHSLMMKIGGILTIVHLFLLCYTLFFSSALLHRLNRCFNKSMSLVCHSNEQTSSLYLSINSIKLRCNFDFLFYIAFY